MEPTDRRKPLYDDDYTTIIIWDMIIHCSGWDFFSLCCCCCCSMELIYSLRLPPTLSTLPPPACPPVCCCCSSSFLLLFAYFFVYLYDHAGGFYDPSSSGSLSLSPLVVGNKLQYDKYTRPLSLGSCICVFLTSVTNSLAVCTSSRLSIVCNGEIKIWTEATKKHTHTHWLAASTYKLRLFHPITGRIWSFLSLLLMRRRRARWKSHTHTWNYKPTREVKSVNTRIKSQAFFVYFLSFLENKKMKIVPRAELWVVDGMRLSPEECDYFVK